MSLYRRRDRDGKVGFYWIDARWHGIPRIQVSTGTVKKTNARAMLTTLRALRDAGRLDVLGLIGTGKLALIEAHAAWLGDREKLSHAVARADAPSLGSIADEWLEWIESAGALSPRTRRPYAPRAVERYQVSLNRIFATLPKGRETPITDVTRGSLVAFRDSRLKDVTGSSVNRDLSALQALRRWCADTKGIRFADFRLPKERENAARFRWLTNEELVAWRRSMLEAQRPFFLILLHTGMRVGEALGLTWGDIYLAESRITIGASGRVKTAASNRDVPIDATLAAALVAHSRCVPSHASDQVFPSPAFRYAALRRAFTASCAAAEIRPARLHDLRHTFAVHANQSGVPIPRLQRLLGHASPIMTLRYAAHAPEAYFAQDSALIETSLNGRAAVAAADESSTGLRIA